MKAKVVTPQSLPKRKLSFVENYIQNYQLVLMVLPGVIALFLFNYLPISGILMAFKDYKVLQGIINSPWADMGGFANFHKLFTSLDFLPVLRNTVVISLLKLVFGFPAPIILALLLNEVKSSNYKKIVQTFSYLPHFFSWVVLSGIMKMLFSSQGPVNMLYKMGSELLGGSGTAYIDFFGDQGMFLMMLILTAVWQGLGWGAIIYIAALSGVDESLYEAAYIDGAGRFKQVIHISIPCIIPTITTVLILNLGSVLNAGVDQVYNMQNETVKAVSNIIDTYVLDTIGKPSRYGLGTAMGLFKSLVGLCFVLTANKITKKISDNELGIL